MKALRKIICLILGASIALSVTACGGSSNNDPETRPLKLAISTPDTNFNPFFATSQVDSEIAGMTQASMISIDSNGDPVCGDDWPSVALDYKITYYDKNGTVKPNGDTEGSTKYEFVIKKGMKFSDGVELTIKDVLFSLYVYLDPAYTGSSTIYSTDIKGLSAYKEQNPSLADGETSGLNFYTNAITRVENLIKYSKRETETVVEKDLKRVKELFKEEAESDWNSLESSWEATYKDNYNFTAAWQAYLYNEGLVVNQTRQQTNGSTVQVKMYNGKVIDNTDSNWEKGKYLTTLDTPYDGSNGNTPESQHLVTEVNNYVSENLAQYKKDNPTATDDYAKLQLQKECCIDIVVGNYTTRDNIADILTYWATANNALEDFAGDERTVYYQEHAGEVESVSGIKATKGYKGFNGVNGADIDDTYDVLSIEINGVDPKALWNFGFAVSPMHYYSNAEQIALAEEGKGFGVKIGDKDFFNDVLKAPAKNGLPVGAGAYKASSASGKTATSKSEFFSNNVVYFERNTYFETMGKNISNAKIKYLQYQVRSDDNILSALLSGEIDYGQPNAKAENYNILNNNKKKLNVGYYMTAGYGYVGINPKYVPDVKIRRAIMKSMDTVSIITNYYNDKLAEPIYRPVSTTSWAYPEDATEYASIAYDATGKEIDALVKSAGYELKNGKYVNSKGETLTFTFTVAGESSDHPAWDMFQESAKLLNSLGFDISVKPDIQALKKLNTGSLAVWAAAWSSGVDPDPYQIYHKDSKATSVNNWGRDKIMNDQTTYWYEYEKVIELSEKIEEGRETLDRTERTKIYSECYDIIMDMAVELPTYQRADLYAYNKKVIDKKTCMPSPNSNLGLLARIWEVNYV